MSEENSTTMTTNNELSSSFTEQDKELGNQAKQEYDGGQYDG